MGTFHRARRSDWNVATVKFFCQGCNAEREEIEHKEAAEKWKFATDMAINEEIDHAKDSGKKDDESH